MKSIKLTPSINELAKLNDFIHHTVSVNEYEVDLIAEEVFVNIVNYSESSYVLVNVESNDSCFKMEFVDDGIEFDPVKVDCVDFPSDINEAEIGGLGIHLVKSIADEVSYEYTNNENHLTIIKNVKK